MVVGAGFFLLPSQIFTAAGAWSPWLLLAVGLGMVPVALSFAEVASRFDAHGGPYLYVRSAFGRLAGFETGWVMWVSRIVSHASVLAGALVLVETVTGAALGPAARVAVVVGSTLAIGGFSVVGGDANARLITGIALAKLAAVGVLIAVALPHADISRLTLGPFLAFDKLGPAAVLALFCVTGFEQLAIPAGEAKDPQRDVPRALLLALGVGLALLVATNVLAIAVVPDLAKSRLALADAARVGMGAAGWAMIAGAAFLAALGNNVVSLLACSRVLQGLVDQGDAPAALGRRWRGAPMAAVAISATAIVALTLSGSFVWLVGLAGGVRVVIYMAVAIAGARLRAPDRAGAAPPPRFRTPAPRLMLACVLLAGCAVLASMTMAQLAAVALGAAAGLPLFALQRLARAGARGSAAPDELRTSGRG